MICGLQDSLLRELDMMNTEIYLQVSLQIKCANFLNFTSAIVCVRLFVAVGCYARFLLGNIKF